MTKFVYRFPVNISYDKLVELVDYHKSKAPDGQIHVDLVSSKLSYNIAPAVALLRGNISPNYIHGMEVPIHTLYEDGSAIIRGSTGTTVQVKKEQFYLIQGNKAKFTRLSTEEMIDQLPAGIRDRLASQVTDFSNVYFMIEYSVAYEHARIFMYRDPKDFDVLRVDNGGGTSHYYKSWESALKHVLPPSFTKNPQHYVDQNFAVGSGGKLLAFQPTFSDQDYRITPIKAIP